MKDFDVSFMEKFLQPFVSLADRQRVADRIQEIINNRGQTLTRDMLVDLALVFYQEMHLAVENAVRKSLPTHVSLSIKEEFRADWEDE